jgi:peptidoglycan/LPS O-acetylase OafA/YrhL
VNWHLVGQHLLFLGAYNVDQFDNPIWSLIQEMRISLIFPALCWLVLRVKTRWSVAIAAGLSAIALLLTRTPVFKTWLLQDSFHFASLFVLGIVLARERERLGAWFLRLPPLARIATGILSLWLYLFGGPALARVANRLAGHGSMTVTDWVTALGAGGLMIVSMNSEACKRLLRWPPVRFLGEVSYSLYLWHFIVMLYCVHLLYGKVPLGAILGLTLVVSLAVSWCSWRWIELPSIALGRRLGDIVAFRAKALPSRQSPGA